MKDQTYPAPRHEILKKAGNGHGGARKGAGKKRGTQWPSTLDKQTAREFVRQKVTSALGPLIDAQIAQGLGLKYLVTRDKKSGKFIRVTEAMAKNKDTENAENEETVEVWEKDPSTPAFTDLMNRAIDKPAEQEQQVAVTGNLKISWQGE